MTLTERLGLSVPVVQAGMGGGVSGHALAAAVSEAGGLGTIGTLSPPALERELDRARELTGRPIAVNILLPFARPAHWEVAGRADAVVTFWGRPRRRTSGVWLHQCGSVEEILAARHAGADGAIVQGEEAGGHVRGKLPAHELLARARHLVPENFALWLAGGIAERDDVTDALGAGAEAVVAGTRFLASEESGAHPGYKQRVVEGDETVVTMLFSAGWPAPHRVLVNAAVRRWADASGEVPRWLHTVQVATAPVLSRAPEGMQRALGERQRPEIPLLPPQPPVAGGPDGLVEAGPLYAGQTVARVRAIAPAARIVAALTP
jgi:NAD(P)H-dependent flavin oxidoreductase YrpB (nitropropane dioxygenase family)